MVQLFAYAPRSPFPTRPSINSLFNSTKNANAVDFKRIEHLNDDALLLIDASKLNFQRSISLNTDFLDSDFQKFLFQSSYYSEPWLDSALGNKDRSLAFFRHLRQSSKEGNLAAQYVLDQLLLSGDGVPANTFQAVCLLYSAATKGSSQAMAALGAMY